MRGIEWLKANARQVRASLRPITRRLRGLPPVGRVDLGDLRRTSPLCTEFGFTRGEPIDRWYIDRFLVANARDIAGRVLEIKDDSYARRLGGDRVTQVDVLDIDPANPRATVIADLARADHLPGDRYDAIVFTQTLQYIYEPGSALDHLHRMLKPGGVLLLTVPGTSTVGVSSGCADSAYWSFTAASIRRLLEDHFGGGAVTVESHGNVLAAIGFLEGLSTDDLSRPELEVRDPDFPVLVTARAVKAGPAR